MTDLPTSTQPIQAEATEFRGPVSESLLQGMGGDINYCLQKVANLLSRMATAELNYGAVGDIVPSMLTLAQFQAIRGTGWVLANGASATGTTYNTITGFANIPDLRGRFLRGKNNGASVDSNGDLALGTLVADQFGSHAHTLTDPGHRHSTSNRNVNFTDTAGAGPVFPYGWDGDTPINNPLAGTGITMANAGAAETYPKYATINFFIRVN